MALLRVARSSPGARDSRQLCQVSLCPNAEAPSRTDPWILLQMWLQAVGSELWAGWLAGSGWLLGVPPSDCSSSAQPTGCTNPVHGIYGGVLMFSILRFMQSSLSVTEGVCPCTSGSFRILKKLFHGIGCHAVSSRSTPMT